MKTRIRLTAVAAGFVCAQAWAAPPAAPASPWAKVPALPTACYSSQDKWQEQNTAAFDALQQEHYEQNNINDAIRQNATDTFGADPMAVAERMQQAMMEDPENAQKIMEQMMQQSQQAQAEAPARHAKEQQFDDESKALMKQYEAALEKASAAGNARLQALTAKYKPMEGTGDLWLRYGDPGEPAWVRPEAHAIMSDWDKAYAATCTQWWGANGQFHAFMKRYRDFLVQERVPYEQKTGDAATLRHYQQIGVSSEGWRTTTDFEAAEDYMKMALSLFEQRATGPYCGPKTPCK
jgi:hypothetical protein